jgi:Mg-chelatase subunit ChlD
MRRFLSIGLAVSVLFGLGLALAPLLPASASREASIPQQRAGEESTCLAERNKVAAPNVLLLGEITNVTLTVKAVCAAEAFPLHIVLVLDASGSMAGQKNADLKKAIKNMIRDLRLEDFPQIQMGIVKFNTAATTLCQLTNDSGRLSACANKVDANGGTAIDRGIIEGLRVLTRGRPRGGGEVREIMVVLSDGGNNLGCSPVLQAASSAKGQGVLIMAVCVGNDCDAACMRQVASSPRYFYQVQDSGAIVQAFKKITEEALNINLKRLNITDLVPANMQYIDQSADPAPASGNPLEGLVWKMNYVPKDGLTITYQLRPLEPGYHPTNVEANGELTDNQNRKKAFDFPVPYVMVLQPFPMATPQPPPPTPTYTPTPPPTPTVPVPPTVTPTNTPPPTPTPVPGPIYLPILLREHCKKTDVYPDVALVLDISTSMDRPTSAGRSKLDATLEAAKNFVTVMDLTPNEDGKHAQVAVVGFNSTGWTEIGLTNDEPAIMRAIDNLANKRDQFTRLDLAFEQGEKTVLGAGHRPDNTPVIVMLTDGLPNRVPLGPDGSQESTVRAKADHAKAAHQDMQIFTIGIGLPTDIDPVLLSYCATLPENYFYEADAEDLSDVYNSIAFSFGCPEGRHDWGKPWE